MSNDQLALIVAGGSLGISVLAFLWTIGWSIWSHQRTHTPRLHVAANFSIPFLGGNFGPQCVGISITNTGVIPVSIDTLTLRVRSDRQRRRLLPSEWMQASLPRPLDVGATWSAPLVQIAHLRQGLAKDMPELTDWRLVALATDPTGREYTADIDLTPKS